MLSRRTFLKTGAASLLAAGAFTNLASMAAEPTKEGKFIWGNLLHPAVTCGATLRPPSSPKAVN